MGLVSVCPLGFVPPFDISLRNNRQFSWRGRQLGRSVLEARRHALLGLLLGSLVALFLTRE